MYTRLTLKPRPSKTEKKQPSFYTNPRAPKNQAQQNGTMTIVMTDITEAYENENYEEPEDEVQEVKKCNFLRGYCAAYSKHPHIRTRGLRTPGWKLAN